MSRHWASAGSAQQCVANVACHLDTLLTDDQKAAINWHDEQSADLAVLRVIVAWVEAGAPDYVPEGEP